MKHKKQELKTTMDNAVVAESGRIEKTNDRTVEEKKVIDAQIKLSIFQSVREGGVVNVLSHPIAVQSDDPILVVDPVESEKHFVPVSLPQVGLERRFAGEMPYPRKDRAKAYQDMKSALAGMSSLSDKLACVEAFVSEEKRIAFNCTGRERSALLDGVQPLFYSLLMKVQNPEFIPSSFVM